MRIFSDYLFIYFIYQKCMELPNLPVNKMKKPDEEKLIPATEIRRLKKRIDLLPEWKIKGRYCTTSPYEKGNKYNIS